MKNQLKKALANQELAFYRHAPLGVINAHARPANDPLTISRKATLYAVARVLGNSLEYWPDNTVRNLVGGGRNSIDVVTRLVRLAGAMRRWAELDTGVHYKSGEVHSNNDFLPEWAPTYPKSVGFNSPKLGCNEVVCALAEAGYNADYLFHRVRKLQRWAGMDEITALDYVGRNSRPRRAAQLYRLNRRIERAYLAYWKRYSRYSWRWDNPYVTPDHLKEFRSWAKAKHFLAWVANTHSLRKLPKNPVLLAVLIKQYEAFEK